MLGDLGKAPSKSVHSGDFRVLRPYSPVGEHFRTMDSANVSRIFAQLSVGESLGCVGTWSLHTSPEPILAHSSDRAELDPGLGLFLSHTLCRQPVTDRDSHQQSWKVKREQGRDWLWPGGQTGLPGRQREQESWELDLKIGENRPGDTEWCVALGKEFMVGWGWGWGRDIPPWYLRPWMSALFLDLDWDALL